jgi:hypothetical protein
MCVEVTAQSKWLALQRGEVCRFVRARLFQSHDTAIREAEQVRGFLRTLRIRQAALRQTHAQPVPCQRYQQTPARRLQK